MQRHWIAGVALAVGFSVSAAKAQDPTLKIGLLTDMSGGYADFFGKGSVVAAQMAIEDAGGSVAGRKIQLLVADHLNKPDVGVAQALRWINNDGVDVILDVPTSSVALAINRVVQEKNKTFLASGPFTSELTGAQCSPNIVHWTVDNWALAHSLATTEVAAGGKTWFFITADYAFGHDLQNIASAAILAAGGKVLGSASAPLDTTDFSSFLLQAQSSGAAVIGLANAGNDATNSVKQAAEFGVTSNETLAGLALVINNVNALGLQQAQGLLASGTFYWDLNEDTRAWARRYQARETKHNMPNEMQAGVYAVLQHYFKALNVVRDPANGKRVVDQMKAMPTQDALFGQGSIRPDGRAIRPMYLFQVKKPSESSGPWDYYKVESQIPAEQAFRPLLEGGCPLVTTQ